jgi:hypothetical protein
VALVTAGVTCRPPLPSPCSPAPPPASMTATFSRMGHQPFSPLPSVDASLNDVFGERVLLRVTSRSCGVGPRSSSSSVLLFSRCGDTLSVRPACLIKHFWQLLPHPYRRSSLTCCVDGKWVANPARTSLLDLGYSGGDTFNVQFSSHQGCLGGGDAALPTPAPVRVAQIEPSPLARRISPPRACNVAPVPLAAPFLAPPTPPTSPPRGGPTAQTEAAAALCEADFVGATAFSHHAQCVLGVQVEMVFG